MTFPGFTVMRQLREARYKHFKEESNRTELNRGEKASPGHIDRNQKKEEREKEEREREGERERERERET